MGSIQVTKGQRIFSVYSGVKIYAFTLYLIKTNNRKEHTRHNHILPFLNIWKILLMKRCHNKNEFSFNDINNIFRNLDNYILRLFLEKFYFWISRMKCTWLFWNAFATVLVFKGWRLSNGAAISFWGEWIQRLFLKSHTRKQ